MRNGGDYQKRAEEAVARFTPAARARASFAYYGELELGETWAGTIGQHRDSDTLSRSNYRTIRADMMERFPEDVSDESSSHWAVGHCDTLYVRMLGEDGKVTPAGIAILEWEDRLSDYPVADEGDYSELENEEEGENWENWARGEWLGAIRNRFKVSDLEIPDAALDEMASSTECHNENGADDPSYPFEKCASALDFSDVLPFDTEGELVSGWWESDSELAPYARSTIPPWQGNGSVSFSDSMT